MTLFASLQNVFSGAADDVIACDSGHASTIHEYAPRLIVLVILTAGKSIYMID